jgi:hypothetical protein
LSRILRGLTATPIGSCVLLALGSLLPPVYAGTGGALAAFFVMLGFSVLNPVLCALRPRWWANATSSFVLWFVVFLLMGRTPGVARMRESAMVFMLPVMIFPPALLLSGVVRWFLERRGRTHGMDT